MRLDADVKLSEHIKKRFLYAHIEIERLLWGKNDFYRDFALRVIVKCAFELDFFFSVPQMYEINIY